MITEAELALWKERLGMLSQETELRLIREVEELRAALDESLKLQSHYAQLLNDYDGGTRMQFKTIDEWLKRLAAPGERQ